MSKTSLMVQSPEKLRCSICDKYLSVFPIYLTDQCKAICGRCPRISNEKIVIRNEQYECVSLSLYFPCSNDKFGCLECFFPPEMPDHEMFCQYRKIVCPINPTCSWNGVVSGLGLPSSKDFTPDLYQHCEESHPTFVLKDAKFEVDFVANYEDSFILPYADELFMLKLKCDSTNGKFICSVTYIGISSVAAQYKYQLILKSGNNNVENIDFEKKPTEVFGIINEENFTEIVIRDIKIVLQDPVSVVGVIEITSNSELANEFDEAAGVNPEMLRELECPICFLYMMPPIYQCSLGHSLCNKCQKLRDVCSICDKDIQDLRNYGLEKVTNFLLFPCKYAHQGCRFTSKALEMKEHEEEFCMYVAHACPVNDYVACNWQGTNEKFISHIKEKHRDNYLDLSLICVPITDNYLTGEDKDCYIIKYGLNLFKLHFAYKDNTFYWEMQLIGSPNQFKNFMFEVDIIDSKEDHSRMYFKRYCSAFTDRSECFKAGQCVSVSLDQIKSFISENLLFRTRVLNSD